MNNLPTATLFKVKPKKLEIWKDWCKQLQNEYNEEAIQTLEEENVICEFFVTYTVDDVSHTLGFALTPDGSEPLDASTERELNHKHKSKKRECLEFIAHVPFSYYLYRFKDLNRV